MASRASKKLTSTTFELLVSIDRDGPRTLRAQIEDQLRNAIREGRLRTRSRLPSTRDLAGQLGVSRPIVVEAFAQLAAEGYLKLRRGARPEVAQVGPVCRPAELTTQAVAPRYDFLPGTPDLSAFPRSVWTRCVREALASMGDADLGYTDPQGSPVLRQALAEYLGRVRGVSTDASRVVITSGFYQGRMLLCRALATLGARRIAVENPSHSELWEAVARSGLEMVPVPVDSCGLVVEALDGVDMDALVLTPAHQYPTGAVLSGDRRAALLASLRARNAIAIEDDYDSEFRYDRAPVGALQGLDPERIVFAGTTSKTLAPALRLGWLVVPPLLREPVIQQQRLADFGQPRIEQHAFALFLSRGELDRHLRRMRARYRSRRDALVESLRRHVPEAAVCGIAAGLHATVRLPEDDDERAIQAEAKRRGVGVAKLSDYFLAGGSDAPTLVVAYARVSEATIEAGVKELAAAIRAVRRRRADRVQPQPISNVDG